MLEPKIMETSCSVSVLRMRLEKHKLNGVFSSYWMDEKSVDFVIWDVLVLEKNYKGLLHSFFLTITYDFHSSSLISASHKCNVNQYFG